MAPLPLFAPGGLGSPELIIILLIAVLLFGANKIPKLARSTGQAIGEFQRGREELEEELDDVRETASVDTDVSPTAGDTDTGPATETTEPAETADEAETETETGSASGDTEK